MVPNNVLPTHVTTTCPPPPSTSPTRSDCTSPSPPGRGFLDPEKVQKSTQRMLQLLLFWDILVLLTGISFISIALLNKDIVLENHSLKFNRTWLIKFGSGLGTLGSVSALCNFMAHQGVRRWVRWFLAPYITFLSLLVGVFVVHMAETIVLFGLDTIHLFHIGSLFLISLIWCKMIKQWAVMSQPDPNSDPERTISPTFTVFTISTLQDLPPKYDTLPESSANPPDYEEAVAAADEAIKFDAQILHK